MRAIQLLVSSVAVAALSIPLAAQHRSGLSDEMRTEIRKIIREEVRAALKDAHSPKTEEVHEWHSEGSGHSEEAHGHLLEMLKAHGHGEGDMDEMHRHVIKAMGEGDHEPMVFHLKKGEGKSHGVFTMSGKGDHGSDSHDGHDDDHKFVWSKKGNVMFGTSPSKTVRVHGKGKGKVVRLDDVTNGHDDDDHGQKGGTWAMNLGDGGAKWFSKGDGKGKAEVKTFSIPGGHGTVIIRRGDGDDEEVDVRVDAKPHFIVKRSGDSNNEFTFKSKGNFVFDSDCCDDAEDCCAKCQTKVDGSKNDKKGNVIRVHKARKSIRL